MARKRRGRGEGAIEQLPSGKWRITLSLGTGPEGKRQRETFTADSKSDVLRWARERQAERDRGQFGGDSKQTLADYLAHWLADKRASVEPLTWKFYDQRARQYLIPIIGGKRLGQLKAADVRHLHRELTSRGVSASEQHKAATTLRAALEDAVREGLLASNPAVLVKKPKKPATEVKPLSAAQAVKFLEVTAADRLGAVYEVMLDAGLRPQEAFGLHWPQVDLERHTLSITRAVEWAAGGTRLKAPKTQRSRRTLRIGLRCVQAFRSHRQMMLREGQNTIDGPVFCGQRGGLVNLSNFHRDSFKPALKAAGLSGVRLYDLRHTCASLLLQAGVSIRVVSERLGHESPAFTLKTYCHVLEGDQDRAADAWGLILPTLQDLPPEIDLGWGI